MRLASLSLIALAFAAALSGVALARAVSGASPPRPDRSAHLLVVPDTPDGQAALARTDARLVARYATFSLVEAHGGDDERLRRAGADRRDDMQTVDTAAGEIDPASDRPSLAAKGAPVRRETLALVQFVGPPKDAWLERLRATGARIVTYQPENAYVVHARGRAVARLAALLGTAPAVRAIGVLSAADKLEGRASGAGRWAVTTVAGEDGRAARTHAAAAAGGAAGAPSMVGALETQYLELSPVQVAALARYPAVVAIEPDGEPRPSDERAAQIVAGNLASTQPSGPGYLDWLVDPARIPDESTFDFAIDVTDSGLDDGSDPPAHDDFREQGLPPRPDRVAYEANYTNGDSGTTDCSGHGTNVASVAAGYNGAIDSTREDGAGFDYGLGVAPFAQIGVSKIFATCGGTAQPLVPSTVAAGAYQGGARISNNSWGLGGGSFWGQYSPRAREYDQIVRDATPAAGNQQLVEVFAAGNDRGNGTVQTPGTAKNVITVGASESVRATGGDGCGVPDASADSASDVAGFSSRGPTDDGRLKPDLVAPGTHVTGAAPQHAGYTEASSDMCNRFFGGSALYSLDTGTSQAAPEVSGAAALLRRWYMQNNPGPAPSPALTKALLVNTATDLGGGQNGKGDTVAAGPNDDQGWGRVNVGDVLGSTARVTRDQLPADVLDSSGDDRVSGYAVADPSKPVKVTLVWTDAPGNTTGSAFVNDLDLVVDAGGRSYKGNVFDGAYSRTGGDADPRNNVESVYLRPGASGRFAVSVTGTTIAGNGVPGSGDGTDQDFALVVSNATAAPSAAPVLVHEETTLGGGDGDGVLEPAEQVQLGVRVRNAGDAAATGLQGSLSGLGGLDVTSGGSAYPNIAAGGTGSNSTPFTAGLSAASICGVDVPASLDVTSSSGPQTIPLLIPTGAPGASLTSAAPAPSVPVAIPDDSAAGASSSIFVPDRGRIKDVNVTIPGTAANPGLRHDSLGDLVIDLTGPDGTTVRLADHPGGPDNSAHDLANVTFDDDASDSIPAGQNSVSGSFRPQADQLSRFDGKDRRGVWTLRVRDLFGGDTGTLNAWQLTTRKAACDVDSVAPDTTIQASAPNLSGSSSATFAFSSNDATASFECRLDGAAYEPCSSGKTYSGLADGSHRFDVRAVDPSDNEDASPASYTWTVDAVPPATTTSPAPSGGGSATARPAAPSFVVTRAEESLADARAGRLTVLAACASACTANARLTSSVRGRGAPVVLGSGARRLAAGAMGSVRVRLSARGRTALRGRSSVKARLRVTLSGLGRAVVLDRPLTLLRSGGPDRLARHGLRLWAACSASCPLRGSLRVSAAGARRLRLQPLIASGRTSAGVNAKAFRLTANSAARKALRRTRRLKASLEIVAGASPGPERKAARTLTLRR